MSEEKHLFHLDSIWVGSSGGDGTLTTDRGDMLDYGLPPQTGGKPGRSNPEEMLLGAVTACYSITLAILAERRRLPITEIAVSAEGELVRQPDQTLKFTAIRLRPQITLASADEAHRRATLDFAHKAEVYCLVSRALRGNVEISVEPEIVTA